MCVLWDRDARRPAGAPAAGSGAVCLWSRGSLANRAELLSLLHLAAGASDAEILGGLHRRYGDVAAGRVEGAVAWVVWDEASRRLVAVRDRMGIEPLCYAERGRTVGIADRAAVLADRLGIGGKPAVESLARHLLGGFPAPGATYFEGIGSLDAGELLSVEPHRVDRRRYWQLATPGAVPEPVCEGAVETAYLEVLGQTVDPRRYALTLSGGLDSPGIAATLCRLHAPRDVQAVTWTSASLPEADERPRTESVARALCLRQALLAADGRWPLCGGLVTDAEAPFRLHYEELWEQAYAWARRRGLRGLVTGAGGDHLFGCSGVGAYAYPDLWLTGRWLELVRQLAEHRRASRRPLTSLVRTELAGPLLHWLLPATAQRKPLPDWLGPVSRRALAAVDRRPPRPSRRLLPGRLHRWQVLTGRYLSEILAAMNRHASRHGIDLLHPLLDRRLVELAAALPSTACYRAGRHKEVLRRVLAGRLPPEVLARRERTSPEALFHRGLRERERQRVWPLLTGMRSADLGLVDESRLRDVYRRYLEGEEEYGFWPALTLEDWLRRHF